MGIALLIFLVILGYGPLGDLSRVGWMPKRGQVVKCIALLYAICHCVAGLLPLPAWVNSELFTNLWVGIGLPLTLTLTDWYNAVIVGEDPWESWLYEPHY